MTVSRERSHLDPTDWSLLDRPAITRRAPVSRWEDLPAEDRAELRVEMAAYYEGKIADIDLLIKRGWRTAEIDARRERLVRMAAVVEGLP